MVWCIFPSPRAKASKAIFKQSSHWVSLYPKIGRPSFHDIVMSTLAAEAQSPGRMIVVGMYRRALHVCIE